MTDLYPTRCGDEPRVLPRLDPVVHSQWHEDAPLTREQSEKFARDGYIVLHDLFTPEEVAGLQSAGSRILGSPDKLRPETIITEPSGDEIRSVFMIHDQDEAIERLCAHDRLAGIARYLLGDDVYVHQSRLNYKPGFVGKEFFWHSDFETWHAEDGMPQMRALSMSILLAPNTTENGPLMVMPGTHRKFIACPGETPANHYLSSLKKQEYGVPDPQTLAELAAEHGIDALTGDAGSVIIFDCNTIHGSNGNITPFPRANAFIVYNAASNRLVSPFGAEEIRPEFIAARRTAKVIRPLQPDLDTVRAA